MPGQYSAPVLSRVLVHPVMRHPGCLHSLRFMRATVDGHGDELERLPNPLDMSSYITTEGKPPTNEEVLYALGPVWPMSLISLYFFLNTAVSRPLVPSP